MAGADTETRIVAIGASAGGLEAIGRLLSHLEPGLGCAYVVLQHLSPSHRSMMADILSRDTGLPVVPLVDGAAPAADTVYVVPAGSNAEIADGLLRLTPVDPEVSPKPSINRFFLALAAEQRDRAVGIILSGTGSDGAAGLRAILDTGGLALVQQPDSAKYEGMPVSAIESGAVTLVATPEELAARLPALLGGDIAGHDPDRSRDELGELIRLLGARTDIDFSGYKTGTILRRIQRRQKVLGVESIAAYTDLVKEHPTELEVLSRDMLISVTSFFRDREVFDVMKAELARVIAAKNPNGALRVWVAGCATGEEAYSLAMIIAELLDFRDRREVQIFATDIDDRALAIARRGVYPPSAFTDVPADLVEKYFRVVDDGYEADKRLRDLIVFARHNLVSDPPFLRLDAVSCRNVLIYFESELQAKVLGAFHFALAAEGVLLLGKSETTSPAEPLFSTIDRVARLYRKVPGVSRLSMTPGAREPRRVSRQRDSVAEQLLTVTAKSIDATVILCDREGNIQHTVGKVGDFLEFPAGTARLALTDAMRVELRGEMLSMLHRFRTTGEAQQSRRRRVGDGVYRVLLEPVPANEAALIAVVIVPAEHVVVDDGSALSAVSRDELLADELSSTREHLHSLLEELATSNEEMQALNEESQAANEELQATNEELEASNEELQATNEELVSLNEEFNIKATELARLSDEYAHLYDTLPFAVLVFDGDGILTRFNNFAASSLSLGLGSVGHPVDQLHLPGVLDDIDPLFDRARKTSVAADYTTTWEERVYRVAVTPVTDDGARVVTFIVTVVDMTDITAAQRRVRDSEARLQALLEVTAVVYGIKTVTGTYEYVNQPFLDIFGLSEQPTGLTDFDVLPRELATELWSADLAALRSGAPQEREHTVWMDGAARLLRSRHRVLFADDGAPTGILFEARDVTAQKEAEDTLRVTASVFEQAGEAIVITDPDGRIQTCNVAFEVITGNSGDEVVGLSLESFFGSANQGGESAQAMWSELSSAGHWRGEIVHIRKSGEPYPAWVTISRVAETPDQVKHYVAVFSDISQIKNVQQRTEFLSTHDELTRLPNRALFTELLDAAIIRSRSEPGNTALLFIDIDHFKNVNDMLGHSNGDELLKLAAHRIRAALGENDTVARFGGDEFVAIVRRRSQAEIEELAVRVVEALSHSYAFGGLDVFSSASVGVAFYPVDGADGETLLNAADAAMYQAKSQGRDRVGLFHPSIRERLRREAAIERGLRRSLKNKDYRLVFQPICQISGREIVGLEALLRWTEPELGHISPAEFIPIAERCGLIVALDRMARDLLLEQLVLWRDAGIIVPPVSLNVSPWCLREAEFADQLLAAMSDAGIPGGHLRVEITESALLQNEEAVRQNLTVLSAAGVRVSIDDFGTGYSSLSYLNRLPLSELKIDQSFTAGLGLAAEDDAVALAILGLAKTLGLSTVAEGIETEQQRRWLEDQGCEFGQGYAFARPCEAALAAALLPRREESA